MHRPTRSSVLSSSNIRALATLSALLLGSCSTQDGKALTASPGDSGPGLASPSSAELGSGAWWGVVRARIEADERSFRPRNGAWHFSNPALGLLGTIDERGLQLEGRRAPVQVRRAPVQVRLDAWGRQGALQRLGDATPVQGVCSEMGALDLQGACIPRLERTLSEGLTEWWVSDAQGLEQGFDLEISPPGAGALEIQLSVEGARARVQPTSIQLRGERGDLWTLSSLAAWDATGRALESTFEAHSSGFLLHVEDQDAVWPIRVDPTWLMPSWSVVGEGFTGELGYSVAGVGDLDGDGYDEVLVGSGSNLALVFPGGAAGVSSSASATIRLDSEDSLLGHTVSAAGDLNGDGYADLAVGAPGHDSGRGLVLVFLGSASGIDASSYSSLRGSAAGEGLGIALASAGDLNGDGFDDLAVGSELDSVSVYLGSASGISSTASSSIRGSGSFGQALAGAGDVNGDGLDDLLVGAPWGDDLRGRAYLLLGATGGLAAEPASTMVGEEGGLFGFALAGSGDLDADGYPDQLVGDPAGLEGHGAVYLYRGGPGGILSEPTILSDETRTGFGQALTILGDANGDGYSDVAIGGTADGSTGAVSLYLGSASGLVAGTPSVLTGETGGLLGSALSGAGDVNGDGLADLIAGDRGWSSHTGRSLVFLGSPSGIQETASTTMSGEEPSLGASLSGAGDVNADGFDDLIVGAPRAASGLGRVWLFHGSASGPSTTADSTLEGEEEGDLFGISVSGVGDVGRDGYDDVLVGASGYQGSNGRVYLFAGSASGVVTPARSTLDTPLAGAGFGSSVGGAGDVNGDGRADVIMGASDSAQAWVHHGSGAGLASTASSVLSDGSSSTGFGASFSGAGDLNDDGFDDVVVAISGVAWFFHGSSGGLATRPATTISGDATFGASVAGAGDVNCDGFDDAILGSWGSRSFEGSATLYLGSPRGVTAASARSLGPDITGSRFGWSVSGVGDFNADGCSEIVVGIHEGSSEGRPVVAILYPGSPEGPVTDMAMYLGPETDASRLPTACPAGDVNGDGFDDLLVGGSEALLASSWASLYLGYGDLDGDGQLAPRDCQDTEATIYTGAPDTWYDGIDSDCAGNDDFDQDGDGHDSSRYGGEDCDDLDPNAWPGAEELVGSGVDEDCDHTETCYLDLDMDGYRTDETILTTDNGCEGMSEALAEEPDGDCDDLESSVHPDAPEIADGADNDCDGLIDEDLPDEDTDDGTGPDTPGSERDSGDTGTTPKGGPFCSCAQGPSGGGPGLLLLALIVLKRRRTCLTPE